MPSVITSARVSPTLAFPSPEYLNPLSHACQQSQQYSNSLHLASESQADGPVTGLATCNGLLFSSCQGDTNSLQAWPELGLSSSAMSPAPTLPPASAVSVDGSEWVATAHKDLKIRLWRTSATGGVHLQPVASLPSLGQLFHNWTLQHRYVQTRRHGKKHAWLQHTDTISALAFSPDRTLLYSASWDRTVKVWNLLTMRCQESFNAHIDSINAMLVGAADGLLYTGSADKSIKVWCRRLTSNKGERRRYKHCMVVALQEPGAAVNAMVMSADESLLYSGGSDGQVLVWRRSSPSWPHKAAPAAQLFGLQEKLQGHARAVLCLDLLQSSKGSGTRSLLVSGSADRTIRVWRQQQQHGSCSSFSRYPNHECIAVVRGHTAPVRSLRVGVVEELRGVCAGVAFSGSLDGSIKMWMLPPYTTITSKSSAAADVDLEAAHQI